MSVMDVARAAQMQQRVAIDLAAGARHVDRTEWVSRYRTALVAVDVVFTLAAVAAALAVGERALTLVALPIVWLATAALCGAYRPNLLGAGAHDIRAVLLTCVLVLAAIPIANTFGVRIDAGGLTPLVVVVTASSIAARWIARRVVHARRDAGRCTEPVLVVGDAVAVIDMVERLGRATGALTAAAVAVPANQVQRVRDLGLPVTSVSFDDPDAVATFAAATATRSVLLAQGGAIDPASWRAVSRACEWHGLQVLFSPAVVDVATSAPVIPVAGVPVLAVPRPGPAGAGQVAKHVIDRVGAGIGLLLAAPLFGSIALAIRLDDRGPVFFRQTRAGADGKPFQILKFRTMRVNAERVLADLGHLNEGAGPLFKLVDDPRVTRVGRVLRKLSLDELPQLWNVVRGDMSLVGPRPPLPSEVVEYSAAERRRLLVRPGITGLWQVGGRSDLTWQESVRLDLSYVESWSLPLDIRVLARTIPAVIRGTGAY